MNKNSYDPNTLYCLVYVRSAKWFVPYNEDAGSGWVEHYSSSTAIYTARLPFVSLHFLVVVFFKSCN